MNDVKRLIAEIEAAFSRRTMPKVRIIDLNVDLKYSIEAQRVDHYLRTNQSIVDRHNSVLVAFNYLTPEAALWIIPFYMKSIIAEFQEDDFIIDVIWGVLCSGTQSVAAPMQGASGIEIKKLATEPEIAAICSFCRWLAAKASTDGLEESSGAALALWCDRS